jgi:long-chain acyl-CoA synthetase
MSEQAAAVDPFEVVVADVRSVPTRVFRHAPPSLRTVWEMSAAFGDSTYLVYGDERIPFADAHRRVASLATRLVGDHGVRSGDRVAIACRSYPEWVLSFWATVSLGAVAVPLNAWWSGSELAYGLAHSGSVVLFADDERAERIAPHLSETSVRTVVLIRSDRDVPGSVAFDALVGDPDAELPTPAADIDPDHDATIMYTSGTTGRPKGAVGTHRNAISHLMNSAYRAAMAAAPPNADAPVTAPAPPATLLTLPLFHVGGLQSFLLPFTASGGKIVLMYRWDVGEAIDVIERERVTAIAGVPAVLFQLLDEATTQGRDLSSLAGIGAGATLVPPELVRRIDRQLEHRAAPANGYGLTETSGAAITNSGADYLSRPDSVGRPISPAMEVRVVDVDGTDAPTGEVGEIWLKGPTVVRGYFDDEVATAEAFTHGWFHTGDLGRLDADGFLYVVDRLKDVVIRGGENVYAAEVEAAVHEHPDVLEVAIVGVPHDRLGEEVGAVVRLRPGATVSADELREHVAARLAAFKVPTHVWITDDELPKNATGKVLKRELREQMRERTTTP